MDSKQFQKCLGSVIRARRAKLGYSQESFADVVGLHRTYVGSIERGERNISVKNLLAIAEALSIPLSSLIALAESEILPAIS